MKCRYCEGFFASYRCNKPDECDCPKCQGYCECKKKGSDSFEEKKRAWWDWHKQNPQVWEYFERFALEAVNKGRKKISHWLIINRIRWEISIMTTGGEFKISNDHIAFYARLWKATYPQYAELFTTKRMIGEPSEVI